MSDPKLYEIRKGMRFFQMYPRDWKWLRRAQCLLLGHATNYFLMDIQRFVSLKNWSRYRFTVGNCSRCGLGWEDWDRFPYGFGYRAPEEKVGEI